MVVLSAEGWYNAPAFGHVSQDAAAALPILSEVPLTKMWKAIRLTDKVRILAFLETDRLYAAYAVGDLEPDLFVQCTWAGAERTGRLEALVLHFRGLELPALFLMGEPDGLQAILGKALCPERVYLTCRSEHLLVTCVYYVWDETIPMWRMVLRPSGFKPVKGDCARLTPGHSKQLTDLYTLGGGIGFSTAQVQHGVFFGILSGDQLVAVAGTHLVSSNYGLGAVGNVFTHPDFRGRGYGTATTSAVVAELLQRGICDIVLNVGQDNAAAIHIYERLGFERYCPFFEGRAYVRGMAQQHVTA